MSEQIPAIKAILAEMGVKWSAEIEANTIQPICKGFFQKHLVAIYKEEADSTVGEVRCLDGYSETFDDLLKSFMTPVDEENQE